MTKDKQIEWMAVWAAKNGFQLELDGEVGFGRECVGILTEGQYPEYLWYNDNYDRIDGNGDVWTPPDAYHKGPYVAVLGTSDDSINQLYQWLQWFDQNGFTKETGDLDIDHNIPTALSVAMGKHRYVRLVKTGKSSVPQPVENPNWEGIMEMAQLRVGDICDGSYHEDNDDPQYMLEAVLETIYGKDYFKWENKMVSGIG